MCINNNNISSNINEVIRAILNFFIQKLHNHKKAQNAYKQIKIKNAPKKHLRGKQSLICLFAFLCVCPSVFVPFSAFCAFNAFQCFLVRVKSFRKKNKDFKIAVITSFILLLELFFDDYISSQCKNQAISLMSTQQFNQQITQILII